MSASTGFAIVGESVWITGGCGGIGLAMAEAFAAADRSVVLLDRDIAAGAELERRFPKLRRVAVDLSDSGSIDAALAPLLAAGDAPDILVNNVGISPKYDADGNRLRSWTVALADWEHVFATNVTAYFLCARHVIPTMIERGGGRIINIASYAARTGGYQPAVHYVASKAAVLGLTKGLAKDLGRHGILVNAINPGRIETAMTRDVSEEVNQALIPSIPVGRLGLPDDIAKATLFLASTLADYMTGTALEVNGGLYMGP